MIIIETCPRCGHDLFEAIACTNPPIPRKECHHCGWFWEGQREQVIRVPFNEQGTPIQPSDARYESVCGACSNNPKNGGSGICNCILGQPQIIW